MKFVPLMLLAGFLLGTSSSEAQNIAINETGALPDTSAMLDIASVNKGLLVPRMSTTQMNAIPLPARGLLIYNTTTNAFHVNTGTASAPTWVQLATGTGGGLTSLNGLTGTTQTFAVGTSGTNFAIASSSNVHTFNLPDASPTARGVVTTGTQTLGGAKTFSGAFTASSTVTLSGLAAGAASDEVVTIVPASGAVRRRATSSLVGDVAWLLGGNANATSTNNILGTTNAQPLRLFTGNAERMSLLANGNVGLGVTDPGARFVVKDSMEIRRVGTLSQLLFTNTAGSGDFRIGGDGGDIFWQGGGGRSLQMGSYWTTILAGDRQTSAFPAFATNNSNTGVLVLSQRDLSTALGVQAFSPTQTVNLTEWRNSTGATMSAVSANGSLGVRIAAPTETLDVNGTTRIRTLNTGAATDDVVTADANGVLRRRTVSSMLSGNAITSLNGLTGSVQSLGTGTTGTDVNWSSTGTTHTLNIPDASATARGLLTTGTQTIAGAKTFSGAFTAGSSATLNSTLTVAGAASLNASVAVAGASSFGGTITASSLAAGATSDFVVTATSAGVLRRMPAADLIGSAVWSTGGNLGINSGNQFIGTRDLRSVRIRTNNVERAVFDSLGRMGLGTTNPQKPLDIVQNLPAQGGLMQFRNSAADGYTSFDFQDNNGIQVGNVGYANASASSYAGTFYFATNTDADMFFATNNVERVRIDGPTGNVGVGTTTPNSTFSVNGSLSTRYRSGTGSYTIAANDYVIMNTGGGATWTLPDPTTCAGRIYRLVNHGTGNITLTRSVTTANGSGSTINSLGTAAASNTAEIMSDGSVWRRIGL
jgi:hypothetical protein